MSAWDTWISCGGVLPVIILIKCEFWGNILLQSENTLENFIFKSNVLKYYTDCVDKSRRLTYNNNRLHNN